LQEKSLLLYICKNVKKGGGKRQDTYRDWARKGSIVFCELKKKRRYSEPPLPYAWKSSQKTGGKSRGESKKGEKYLYQDEEGEFFT